MTVSVWFINSKLEPLLIKTKSSRAEGYLNIFMRCLRYLCKQDVEQPSACSDRVLITGWILFCLVITYIYSGVVTAYLTKPAMEMPIKTLNQLLNQNKFKTIIPYYGGIAKEQFLSSPTTADIWRRSEKISDLKLGFDKTKNGEAILIKQTKELYYIHHQLTKSINKPVVIFANDFWNNEYLAFAVAKNSKYKLGLNKGIIRLSSAGLIQKWRREFLGPFQITINGRNDKEKKILNMQHLAGAFYILICGNILASVIFLLEEVSFIVNKTD